MKNSFTISKFIYCTLIMLIIACFDVSGQQTKKISLQGFLKDANGKAVQDGSQDLIFKLYKALTGGTADWTETQALNIIGGVYSTHLGKTESLENLNWGANTYYVGVTVQGIELTPRTELTFAPYSLGSPKAQEVVCSGAVGDVKYSILNPTQFAAVNGECWVPMDGRNMAGSKLAGIIGGISVPDGGGLFIRAQESANSTNDPERTSSSTIATLQGDDNKNHNHSLSNATVNVTGNTDAGGTHTHTLTDSYMHYNATQGTAGLHSMYLGEPKTKEITTNSAGSHTHSINLTGNLNGNTSNSGTETRPKNMNFYIYIRIN